MWFWASPIEARLCRQEEIVLVGGGNSAGQAAVFLSGFALKVWMLLRGDRLAESMSRYLIDRIGATPNIEANADGACRPVGLAHGTLDRVRWRHNPTGKEIEKPIRNVLVFIGADPATHWLKDCGVLLDRNGLVRTGPSLAPDELAMNARLPMLLESNIFGVFAVGDVRCGSVKRVGGAIGEGAAVVPELHSFFMDTPVAPQCGPEELWPKVGDGSLKQPISRVTEYCGRSARSSRPA